MNLKIGLTITTPKCLFRYHFNRYSHPQIRLVLCYCKILIFQKYDPDPAAKAAAASVLASKLGADSGLHWFVDESHLNQHDTGKIGNVEFMQSSSLRRRNASEARSHGSMGACRDAFRHLFGTRAAIYYQSEKYMIL
ncbi:putative Lunapark family protein [Helianthus annuus]|nr:putative Lunapark family protein [Helianthus annuus]